MSERHESLIRTLAQDVRPVRVLLPPWQRAVLWLGACVVLAGLLLWGVGRLDGPGPLLMPDKIALGAAALTAIASALAAFSLAVPGRHRSWAALPIPPLLVWVAASCWSCGVTAPVPPGTPGDPAPMSCFRFIVLFSAPLTALIYWMLRRAYCVRLLATSTLAGLAVASVGAVVLVVQHPHGMVLTDFVAHFGAVLLVVAICRYALPPMLRPE